MATMPGDDGFETSGGQAILPPDNYPIPNQGDSVTFPEAGVPAPAVEEGGVSRKWIVIGVIIIAMVVAGVILYIDKSSSTTATASTSSGTASTTKKKPTFINIIENRPGVPPTGPAPTPPTSTSKTTSPVSNLVVKRPLSGTTFTEAYSGATAKERLAALQAKTPTTLPNVGAAQVGLLKQFSQKTQAISGVLPNGVAILNRNAPWSQQQALLASDLPVSIEGQSGAQVGYLKSLAKHGKLKGIRANGQPIL